MIDYNVMDSLLKSRQAELIKVSERMSKGKYIKTVKYNGEIYKLCPEPDCLFYKTLNNFTFIKSHGGYHTKCKKCRNSEWKNKYYNDLDRHIYARWSSIVTRVDTKRERCSLEEFRVFFNNAKCPYTGRTLVEEFNNPNPNKMLQLEIDHIVPVTKGGGSTIDNLHVMPKVINQIKRNSTPAEFRETLNFLSQFAGVKK
jgi:hypothetical protein